jgi:hypothetical protein
MGRASGDIQINGDDRVQSVRNFRAFGKDASGDRAAAHGNDNLGVGHGLIGLAQCLFHIPSDRAGDHNPVGMPRRGDKLDTEPAEIKYRGAQHIDIGFAGSAAAGGDLPQFQRTAENFLNFLPKARAKIISSLLSCKFFRSVTAI